MISLITLIAGYALIVGLIAAIVALDVRKRGSSGRLAWATAVMVFVLWPLALYIWAFVRGKVSNSDCKSFLDKWIARNI